ncbi:MAG TPA: glycosyltransferase family 4 protein [Vicinamibacterales bacterium]|nr:glycosyltransferase family 4 protein [Vicinamibacterales bacterium]
MTVTATAPPLRVAFLSVSAEMGGSEVSLLELVRGLRRIVPAWPLDVIVPREGPLPRAVEASGARAHILPLPERLTRVGESRGASAAALIGRGASLLLAAGSLAPYSRRLERLLSELSPDVVHSNGFKVHVLSARVMRPPAALVWHIHEYVARRPISRRLLRRYIGRCAALVANSRSVASEVTAALDAPVPVTTIHNAVDTCEFSPVGDTLDLDRLAGLPPAPAGTVRVGLVATYGRWKGHMTFLEAIRKINPAIPCRAYIIGGALYDTSGSQHAREELERTIASPGLAGRVGLTGFVNRPAAALRALDVVVHASTQPEPFGLVIAEGLASGRAVIVSAAGGAAELVTDGVDALTHAPGDAQGLATCIERLASDAALRARLGEAGRRSAIRQFDPDDFTRAFIDVYQEARARVTTHAGH